MPSHRLTSNSGGKRCTSIGLDGDGGNDDDLDEVADCNGGDADDDEDSVDKVLRTPFDGFRCDDDGHHRFKNKQSSLCLFLPVLWLIA